MAIVKAINISERRGIIKHPVESAELRIDHGIVGDAHAGNWHRQISLLAQESIDKMTAMGVEGLDPGKFAENITTEGIELHTLPVGTRLQIGACLTEVTQIGKKCHKHCEIYHKIGMCIMPQEGIFVKVLRDGIIQPGDEIRVCKSQSPIARELRDVPGASSLQTEQEEDYRAVLAELAGKYEGNRQMMAAGGNRS